MRFSSITSDEEKYVIFKFQHKVVKINEYKNVIKT